MHGQRELEGEPISRLIPLSDAASLNHLGGNRTLYEIYLTPTEGVSGRAHLFLARVPVRPAGGAEVMVGALPHPGEIDQVIAPTAAILKTALNQSQALVATRLKLFQHQLLVFLAILGILGFWVGLVMIRRLTRQICSLTRAAEAFNRGELDYRIPKPGDDELGRLAQTLNQMAASLKENTVSRFVWENTFNIIPDLIMVLDADQRITRLNRAAAEHLGTTPEEARGRPCCELLPAASEAPPVFALLNGVSAGNQGQKEFYWEHQGRTFLGTVNLLSNRDGQIVGAVHVSRDLTVFKQMQRDLAHASHFLNLIVDAAPLALAVVNREGLFTHINPQVLEEYGYSPDEILDRHFSTRTLYEKTYCAILNFWIVCALSAINRIMVWRFKMAFNHTFKYFLAGKEVEETKSLSATKAIRYKCLDCSGGSVAEVRCCGIQKCPLWPFRMGKSRPRSENTKPNLNFLRFKRVGREVSE